MRSRAVVLASFLALGISSVASAQTLGAVLTGSQEVPPTTSPGFGNFTGTFDAARANMTVTLTVTNLGAAISGFHIHEKVAGTQSGGVIVNFPGQGGTFVNNKMTGTFAVPADVAARMLANPSNFYVNVHTTQFGGGAIRGDLAIASDGVVTYAADLRGSNEFPVNSSAAFGSAFVTIDTINNTLAWEVNTSGIASPSASHIHGPNGAAGTNAGVLIAFASNAAAFTAGRTKGSVSIASLSAENRAALLTSPSNFYVNVHSTAFGGGEIRGQLVPANEYDVPVAGRVVNGAGTTFVTDLRIFNPSYDSAVNALIEYFQVGTSANTNATQSLAVNIPPRGTASLDDVTGATGLNVSGSTGALRVSAASKLAVTSRIYADFRASGKGTIGQFAAGAPRSNALRRGVLPQLSNQSDLTSGSRTNIGFFNPTTQTVTVRLELRDASGAATSTGLVTLQPLSQQQNSLGTYFPGTDLSNAQKLTLSFDANAPIVAYASVVDNVSTDQIFVYAQEDSGVATAP
ncbi:MAG: CHRD domain-containing protein [Acidobacteriota bacterium]